MLESLLIALAITWKGMLGIFVASLIIMLTVMIMGKLGQEKPEKKEEA